MSRTKTCAGENRKSDLEWNMIQIPGMERIQDKMGGSVKGKGDILEPACVSSVEYANLVHRHIKDSISTALLPWPTLAPPGQRKLTLVL